MPHIISNCVVCSEACTTYAYIYAHTETDVHMYKENFIFYIVGNDMENLKACLPVPLCLIS